MTDRDCERWIAIVDAEVLGESLSAAEREFEREHQAACPRCRSEASIWSTLRPSRLQVVPSAEDVDEILKLAARDDSGRTPSARGMRVSPRAIAVCSGATLIAAAAGVALWLASSESSFERGASVAAVSEKAPLVAGRYPRSTCNEVASGITLCVAAGSELSSVELAPPHRSFQLDRGHLVASIAAQPPGTSFSVATKDGKVTVVGAELGVEVAANGESWARVHQGKALARAAGAPRETFLAPEQTTHLGTDEIQPVAAAERARDLQLLSLARATEP
jgi:ferric-dicitrate binding protein FerR (iron transport regulator)